MATLSNDISLLFLSLLEQNQNFDVRQCNTERHNKEMKKAIKNTLLSLNYGIAVAICLLLIVSQQVAVFEKAMIGFGAIAFGMLVRRIINWAFPENKSASSQG